MPKTVITEEDIQVYQSRRATGGNGYVLLPPGRYVAKLDFSQAKEWTSAANGSKFLPDVRAIVRYQGRDVDIRFNFYLDQLLDLLDRGFNQPVKPGMVIDTKLLDGREVGVVLRHHEYNGLTYNRVTRVIPRSEVAGSNSGAA
jgi:hypothetical protein